MNIVVFDLMSAQPAGKTKFHGGGEYIKTVFRYFVSNYNKSNKIIVCINKEKYIDDWVLNIIKSNAIEVRDVKSIENIVHTLELLSDDRRVYFFAGLVYAYRNVKFPRGVFSVGTCHGLRAIEKPNDIYQLKYLLLKNNSFIDVISEIANVFAKQTLRKRHDMTYSLSIAKFDVIVTDSMHSLYSIILNYPKSIRNKEVHVLYPMTQEIPDMTQMPKPSDKKFIMIISANRWIKNSYRACLAIDSLYSKGLLNGIKTRVYGNMPKKMRSKFKNRDGFVFYDYVSSEELEKAYAECSVFFYPTLNEGFGNVPMEAMKYGKTCVVSAVCSLPEVYKDSVLYCNPYDLMEMQNRLLQAIEKKIDTVRIDERLKELYSRQEKDMAKLCSIIQGTNK